jgi:single-strand DNA-binding protein
MPHYNKVIIIGHMARDPELRSTPSGTAIAQFTVGINREWKGKDGEAKKDVAWVGCEAWGKSAETIGQYMRKGSAILVDGRLQTDSWEDKATGKKQSKLKVVVESFQFMGKRDDDGAKSEPQEPARVIREEDVPGHSSAPKSKPASKTEMDEDSEVPF